MATATTKKTKNRRDSISSKTKTNLWRASGGRCEFNNCNTPLWIHEATMGKMNKSYIAHIHAVSPKGPRYDPVLSPQLETAFSNLMLVCDECHRTFDDKSKERDYPASKLFQMKKSHEERIERLTGISPDMKTNILLFGAKIGHHTSILSYSKVAEAILPNYYPSQPRPIEIGLKAEIEDHEENYWLLQEDELVRSFNSKINFIKEHLPSQHFSVFALAPQPLLIKLGTLLNDISDTNVYQLHREPQTWNWLDSNQDVVYSTITPSTCTKNTVALKIELSAGISDDRITNVLGPRCDIWSITHPIPDNDYLKSRKHLSDFRKQMRETFNLIKSTYGEKTTIHVFPAMPVSAAIEFGRVWMPKADLPMILYDQNHKREGFIKTIKITH